jgi:hypothetical protein
MVIWCLFDGSGIMGLPWAEKGHQVFCVNADDANHGEYTVKMKHENLYYINAWISVDYFGEGLPKPDFIFAFPDCTYLAGSGEKHERAENDIAQAVALAKHVEKLGNEHHCPWMVENPVGKLSTEWRKPDAYFDPYEYGGYCVDDTVFHPRMPGYDGYTKKTCLWFGNGFRFPDKRPVAHIGKFWGWAYLGGKSAKTKQLRSLTPRGFANAVFVHNTQSEFD